MTQFNNDSVDSDGTLNLKPNMGKKWVRTAEVVMYEQLKGCTELDTGRKLVDMTKNPKEVT